jgi:hypothetical protein
MAWLLSGRKPRQAERRRRPTLEALEDRLVPHALSGFNPNLDWLPALATPVASTSTGSGSGGTSTGAATSALTVPAYSSLPGAPAT